MKHENLAELKKTILTHLANDKPFPAKVSGLKKGNSNSIQEYLIKNARLAAKKETINPIGHAERAWLYCEYLSKYDPYVDHESWSSKVTLEGMIERTDGGNYHTASEFLNYISSSIAHEASKSWDHL